MSIQKIQEQLDWMHINFPDWDSKILSITSNENKAVNEKKMMDGFTKLMNLTAETAKADKLTKEETVALFEGLTCKNMIEDLLESHLGLWWASRPLCELEKKNPYEAERLLDIIWSQYVVRFDSRNTDMSTYPITENEFDALCIEIDNFADECVKRQLTSAAIRARLQKRTDMSTELIQYLTDKMDRDWTELKLNYIIYQLGALRTTIRKLQRTE